LTVFFVALKRIHIQGVPPETTTVDIPKTVIDIFLKILGFSICSGASASKIFSRLSYQSS